MENLKNIKSGSRKYTIHFLVIAVLFFSFSTLLISQSSVQPYLAPAKDYTPQIYKYIFTSPLDNAINKQESQESKQKKIHSILNDTLENRMDIIYDNSREISSLIVKVKDGEKKINISIYNLIGNKVADVYKNKAPGSTGFTEVEIVEFKDTKSDNFVNI